MINMVVSPAFSLLPLLVKDHFQGQAINLAAFESALGFGMLAGGLLLGVWGGFKRKMKTSLLGLCLMGSSILVVGLVPGNFFWAAVAATFVTGGALALTNGPIHAILQSVVDPNMQGRVFTLIGSVATAMTPIGLALAGPLADLMGVQTWFVAGGTVTLLMAVFALMVPAIYRLEDNHRSTTGTPVVLSDAPVPASGVD
jgi:DHA3 family macrolide efflux protein-like MFS transporter